VGQADRLPPDRRLAAAALEALPGGVAVFDADWTIAYINAAGAELLGRGREELVGRGLWIALPEFGGTILHSFLLHARSIGGPVTWRGFYPPGSCWLHASAVRIDDRLHVSFLNPSPPVSESELTTGVLAGPEESSEHADHDRLRFLAEVSEAMIGTLDTGKSTSTLAELVVPRLCDWSVVTVMEDQGGGTGRAHAHRDRQRLEDLDTYLNGRLRGTGDESPLAAALMSGEPVQLAPIDPALFEQSLGNDEVRAAWRRLDATSCTIVPLRTRTETFGALALMNCADRPPHTELQIATAVEVARRGALALDNARLYGRQLKVAETLQRSLLSPPPQPDHLEIGVRYRPAASNMHVGGDWYDAFAQPDGATLLVIGDVVGHNVDAAAAMGQIRSILRGIAYDRADSPAGILARVDHVIDGLHIATLATAQVARIEQPPQQAGQGLRTLRWSSAGHLPPLLLRADGHVEVLHTSPEILLGAEPSRIRTDHTALLHPGDTVIFYTDGLIEHGRTDIDSGITRLTRALADSSTLAVEKLCDRLLDRIITSHPDDDIALVVLRCHPHNANRPRP
jgi:phosphoserine phosphatase RsbU/P